MCDRYGVCGYRHFKKKTWLGRRSPISGKYQRDRRLLGYFFASAGVISILIFSFIGVNTIFRKIEDKLASLSSVVVVENTRAEISWQEQVKQTLKDYKVDVIKAERIINCESRWDPQAIHVNRNGSLDIGLWQFSNKYHPEISKSCSLDPDCSTVQAIRIIKTTGWKSWICNKYDRER